MRPGYSLVELIVGCTIGVVLCAILAAAFVGAQRLARLQAERVAMAEARRVAAGILASELGFIAPDADLHALARDSVALRIFRGRAVACGVAGDAVLVRYRGVRAPEPAKDSVIPLGGMLGWYATDGTAGGGVAGGGVARGGGYRGTIMGGGFGGLGIPGEDNAPVASALLGSAAHSAGCPLAAGESLYRWTLESPPLTGTLFLLFESGSYHLAGGALRYRRGESGRQPLTAEWFDDSRGGLRWVELEEEGYAPGETAGDAPGGVTAGAPDWTAAGAAGGRGAAGIELVLAGKPSSPASAPGGTKPTRYWIGLRNRGHR